MCGDSVVLVWECHKEVKESLHPPSEPNPLNQHLFRLLSTRTASSLAHPVSLCRTEAPTHTVPTHK